MKISNANLKNLIRWSIIGLGAITIADVVIAQTTDLLTNVFRGYSAFVVPLLTVAAYAYIGMPIFQFNADSNVLRIKSHLAFTDVFGKELYVAKKNIIRFEIDRQRVRKKLKVHYLKDGKEFSQSFSIALLSNKKIEKLARQVELIHSEVNGQGSYHLFI